MAKPKRRQLLVFAAATAGGNVLGCGGEEGSDDDGSSGSGGVGGNGGEGGAGASAFPPGYVDLGPVAALPVGSLVTVAFVELLVGRDAAGVYAMNSRCTHQLCNMIGNDGVTPGNITVCGCHGSEFDPNGVPIKGPATKPLPHYSVLINDALHIGVNIDVEVVMEERAAVPA